MNVGNAIKKIRLEMGITQGALAQQCNISQTSLYQIEKGIKRPNPKTLASICKHLVIPETILYLYGLEDSDIPEKKKDLFKLLYPTVQEMIMKLVVLD